MKNLAKSALFGAFRGIKSMFQISFHSIYHLGDQKKILFFLAPVFFFLYMSSVIVASIIAPVRGFTDGFGAKEVLKEKVHDAKGLYEYVFENGGMKEGYFRMDSLMIQKIMEKVYSYNEDRNKKEILETTARTYLGDVSFDHITGKTIKEEEEYTQEAFFVTVERNKIDKNPFGGSIFDIEWPPVLVLCLMVSEERESVKEGESAYISDETIDKVVSLFQGTFLYLDDPLNDEAYDASFERIDTGNKGYLLDITGNKVIRTPAVAPIRYTSNLFTYEYIYETLPNGYLRLTARNTYYTTSKFLKKVQEIIPDFSEDIFLENLGQIPGCEEMREFFEQFFHREIITDYTNSASVCPAIGTYVSTLSENAKILE